MKVSVNIDENMKNVKLKKLFFKSYPFKNWTNGEKIWVRCIFYKSRQWQIDFLIFY